MRIYFATDIHGSESCWRKFLRSAEFYEADVLILGGDMTGKALVPIVDAGDGTWNTVVQGQRRTLRTADEVANCERLIRKQGLYPHRVRPAEARELEAQPELVDRALRASILDVVAEWVGLADSWLGATSARVFVCPGNDDVLEIDDVLRASQRLELAEGHVISLGNGFELLSTGWTNRTPWHTDREEDESALAVRIAAMTNVAAASPDRLVFNFHCPPYGTPIDEAPEISSDFQVIGGGRVLTHVGSNAVRAAIDDVQPILSLHGHVHDARGVTRLGRTLAVNPGSAYESGTLLGVVVELDGRRKVKRYQLTMG